MNDQSALDNPWSMTDDDVNRRYGQDSDSGQTAHESSYQPEWPDDFGVFEANDPGTHGLPTFAPSPPRPDTTLANCRPDTRPHQSELDTRWGPAPIEEQPQPVAGPPAGPEGPSARGEHPVDGRAVAAPPAPQVHTVRAPAPAPSNSPTASPPAASRPSRSASESTASGRPAYRVVDDKPMVRTPDTGVTGLWHKLNRRLESRPLPPEQLMMNLKKPLSSPAIVAVVNHSGGSGKSTMTAGMGQQLATHRRDRVIAVDAAVAIGGLSQRLPVNNESTIQTLLDNIGAVRKWSDARQHTSQGRTGLELLTSGSSIADDAVLTAEGYRQVIGALTANDAYNLILVDCDAGVNGPLMDAVFDSADVLVVPLSGMDGVAGAVTTMNRLAYLADKHPQRKTHYRNLIADAVVVVNHIAPKSRLKEQEVSTMFLDRIGVRSVVSVPFDPVLVDGAPLDIVQLSKRTSTALLRLAAEVITSVRRSAV